MSYFAVLHYSNTVFREYLTRAAGCESAQRGLANNQPLLNFPHLSDAASSIGAPVEELKEIHAELIALLRKQIEASNGTLCRPIGP